MDYDGRVGHRTGSGPALTKRQLEEKRRDRLRQFALQTIDLKNDPYIRRNAVGKIECALCHSLHINEGCYLTHTQSKKHQINLRARSIKELRKAQNYIKPDSPEVPQQKRLKYSHELPRASVSKVRERATGRFGVLCEFAFEQGAVAAPPAPELLNYFEQNIEPEDPSVQYLVVKAFPYRNAAVRLPAAEISRAERDFLTHWDAKTQVFRVQLLFAESPIIYA